MPSAIEDVMSIAYDQSTLQQLYEKSPVKPQFHDGELLSVRMVGRDPLTYRAYFDATSLTKHLNLNYKEKARREARFALGHHFALDVHRDMIKVKSQLNVGSPIEQVAAGSNRGMIVGFSRASRKRLIEFMASVRYTSQLLFATFTYPDEFPEDETVWKAHFEALRRRFERKFPKYRAIWRIELKERLSGEKAGTIAPHYHMIIFTDKEGTPDIRIDHYYSYGKMREKCTSPVSREFEVWSRQAWSEIVNSGDKKHEMHGSFVVAVRNKRHAMKYVSKYVAKEDKDEFAVGRRWGRIGSFDTEKSKQIILSQRQYIEFRRLVRKWMKSHGRDYHKNIARSRPNVGMTVLGLGDGFDTAPEKWFDKQLIYRMLAHVAQITCEPIFGLPAQTHKPNAFLA